MVQQQQLYGLQSRETQLRRRAMDIQQAHQTRQLQMLQMQMLARERQWQQDEEQKPYA
jgi:hypothetical protein